MSFIYRASTVNSLITRDRLAGWGYKGDLMCVSSEGCFEVVFISDSDSP